MQEQTDFPPNAKHAIDPSEAYLVRPNGVLLLGVSPQALFLGGVADEFKNPAAGVVRCGDNLTHGVQNRLVTGDQAFAIVFMNIQLKKDRRIAFRYRQGHRIVMRDDRAYKVIDQLLHDQPSEPVRA